jgi:hypothetical protein
MRVESSSRIYIYGMRQKFSTTTTTNKQQQQQQDRFPHLVRGQPVMVATNGFVDHFWGHVQLCAQDGVVFETVVDGLGKPKVDQFNVGVAAFVHKQDVLWLYISGRDGGREEEV